MSEPETYSEQLERVKLMASGDPTWDLSENDIAALKAVLARAEGWDDPNHGAPIECDEDDDLRPDEYDRMLYG